jgi:hypothetical protein
MIFEFIPHAIVNTWRSMELKGRRPGFLGRARSQAIWESDAYAQRRYDQKNGSTAPRRVRVNFCGSMFNNTGEERKYL